MNPLKKLQKLLTQSKNLSPVKNSKFDREKNSITITDIHDSSVVINLLDEDDLEKFRNSLEKSLQEPFDLIISFFKTPQIQHFFSIAELKTSTERHRFLFENKLVFFTAEEIEAHYKIIQHIQENRVALLLGFPATGKSISVIDIADKLTLEGYTTYYFSFKKIKHWPEIWAELKTHANEKTVFVLDDVHLDPETAGTALNRLENNPALNILFISREVYKNRNFTDTRNIYKELDSSTVRTAQPNINKKANGIVCLYQAYYQKNLQGSYPIGDFNQINKNVHRNLIVLNAYLHHWTEKPNQKLSTLQESELYHSIYNEYFRALETDTRNLLLQYLCIYYFEVEFHQNPKNQASTKQLLIKGIITKNKGDMYSIYHGEYAFLLLKAFRVVEKKQFHRLGNTWTLFFVKQIKQYLDGFIDTPNYYYPDNLLEILTTIPRFTKEVHGGIKDTNAIFKQLIEVPKVKKLILKACKEEEEDKNITFFLFSILQHFPNQFEVFLKAFKEKAFDNKYALGIYCSAYKVLYQQNQLEWFEADSDLHLPLMIENSNLNRFGNSLSSLSKFFPIKAKFIYSKISISDLLSKIENTNLNKLGLALNELKNIDPAKTKNIYDNIDINEERFQKMVLNTNLNNLGKALNELKNIDLAKTKNIYDNIDINEERFQKMVLNTNLNKLGLALNELKNIDPAKTKNIYDNIDINGERFQKMVLNTNLNKLGLALNELKNIDPAKTKNIYDNIDINEERFQKMVLNTNLNKLGLALNQLKNIDPAKTKNIYDNIDINEERFQKMVLNTNLNKLGLALNQLKNIDPEKTMEICTLSETSVLSQVKSSKLKYKAFIEQISLLSCVSQSLGVNIYELVSEENMYQFDKLNDIYTFNLFVQYLFNIDLPSQDKNFIKVIRLSLNNSLRFLKYYDITSVSVYIGIMAKLNLNISTQISKGIRRHTSNLLKDTKRKKDKRRNKNKVPRFIANVFMHSPSLAIDKFLGSYQSTYPNDKIMLVNVYIEIAKNKAQIEDKQTATHFLQKAKNITQILDNQDLENRITYTINKYDLDL